METGVWISLAAYFLLMLAIGVYAWKKSTSNSEEYMLGGRDLSPSVAALSAGASDMSGWLLLGLPGALFVSGLSQSWIGIGLVIGAWLNWLIVAPRLRQQTEEYDNSLTIPGFLGNRFPSQAVLLRIVSAVVIVVFFSVYTASGLVGGGKLFASAFGGDYMTGVVITLGVVLVYTVMGGFLAVSLTDFVQGNLHSARGRICTGGPSRIHRPLTATASIDRTVGHGETHFRLERGAGQFLSNNGIGCRIIEIQQPVGLPVIPVSAFQCRVSDNSVLWRGDTGFR